MIANLWCVTWLVTHSIACNNANPDPYGRQVNTAEAIYCTSSISKCKQFETKEEADKFVKDAPPNDWTVSDFKAQPCGEREETAQLCVR